jgi:hypothetical protein
MVAWRNTAGDSAISDWQSPTMDRIAFHRGNRAFVALNRGNDAWQGTLKVSGDSAMRGSEVERGESCPAWHSGGSPVLVDRFHHRVG